MKREVPGFRFGAATAGIKTNGRPDLGLLLADSDVPVAAVFTRNRVKGAPVLLSQERAKLGVARAVIVHAGIANACTGKPGLEAAQQITRLLARSLAADEKRLLIAGTGVLGAPLPTDAILAALPDLISETRAAGLDDFARAILTTDRTPKVAMTELTLGRGRARVLGCAKGSGMIAPNLGTTLAFVVTDAVVEARFMRSVLRDQVDATFNDVSVDGESSPNDTVLLLASGRLENKPLDGGPSGRAFRAALHEVLDDLALQVVRDGPGETTRVVTIEIAGATDGKVARAVARRIAGSALVKAAIHGAQPDWGRIVCAVGGAGVDIDPDRLEVHIGEVAVLKGGVAVGGDAETQARAVMRRDAYSLRVHLHSGRAEGRHVTCELSPEALRRA